MALTKFGVPVLCGWWLLTAGAVVKAAGPRLNEWVADNKNGLSDEDGDEVDWLEVFNPDPVAVDLTGWYLSDASAQPAKWAFPAVSLNANGYLVVFASGKDRRVPGHELHTNFSLRAAGEELLLTNPDGTSAISHFSFGPQRQDVSYGATALTSTTVPLITPSAPGRALVPSSGVLGTSWTAAGFDDSAWQWGTMDLGFETASGYESLIGLDVRTAMSGQRTSCYLRMAFPPVDLTDALSLTLRMRYDDGFAVYLNGTLLPTAGRNAPSTPLWNSTATADHPDAEAVIYEDISLSQHLGLLKAGGPNVLAIHGMNRSAGSSDFLIGPQLQLARGTVREGFMVQPTPGGPNAAGVLGLVGDTHFSVDRGFYQTPVEVVISCGTPDTLIRYTRNGDTPTSSTGFVYSGPIVINSTTVLRAAAFRPGWQPSNVDTHSYLFPDEVIVQSPDGSAPAGWPSGYFNN